MQIITLPKNFYKAYDYALKYSIFHEFREKYEKPVREQAYLRKRHKMSFKDLSEQLEFSRATYYRRRKILNELDAEQVPIRAPRALQLRRWSDAEIALVLHIRRENPTYGKFKIYHILKRDHSFQMSKSTVGRILKYLMDKGKIIKSISSVRTKRRRKFNSHTKPAPFKKYDGPWRACSDRSHDRH